MALIDVIRSKTFNIILSMMLGLALASFFKKSCKGRTCFIVKAPNPHEITNNYYKFDDKCYKFKTNVTNCGNSGNNVIKS
jgi:hypothetical protein